MSAGLDPTLQDDCRSKLLANTDEGIHLPWSLTLIPANDYSILNISISIRKRAQYTAMVRPVKVAAVQAEPGWNNLQASVDKTISLIEDAGEKGANVLGFPAVFIPGYPWSIWHHSPLSNTQFIHEYVRSSLVKESSETE